LQSLRLLKKKKLMIRSIKKLRSHLLELLTHKIALPLILVFRNKTQCNYTMEQLLTFPDGTLGKNLALYLKSKGFGLIPGYLRHDCKHILLGYEMDEEGEAGMQLYFLGNRHYSAPVVLTSVMCFLLMPDKWKMMCREFKKGRNASPFKDTDFAAVLSRNVSDIRRQFGINYTC
jgi:ubiquinone biosynthesis protein Coq4